MSDIKKYEEPISMEIKAGSDIFGITEEEFKKIDEFIQKGKTGLIRLKNGEYVNLSYVSSIKNKKNNRVYY